MIKRILILALLLAGSAGAVDRTPYNIGSIPSSRGTQTIKWISEHVDFFTHYRMSNSPALYDSILDSAAVYNAKLIAGFYASSQEISAYIGDLPNWDTDYLTRMQDTADVWLYLLVKHYLDSIGVDVDTCCLHWLDTAISVFNEGGDSDERTRIADRMDTLEWRKRRVSYQHYDNDADDDGFYPAGYLWLANGMNQNTREAIAYAFRLRAYDPVIRAYTDDGYGPFNYLFMDNQFPEKGFLTWYWGVTYAEGGPTGGVDFEEGGGTYQNIDVEAAAINRTYFDASTAKIDSAVKSVLDSTSTALGYDTLRIFANVTVSSATDALRAADYLHGIFGEVSYDIDRNAQWWNQQFIISAGIIADHPHLLMANYTTTNRGAWFDEGASRCYMGYYCANLVLQNYNSTNGRFSHYSLMSQYADFSDRWYDIYYVDIGYPIADTSTDLYKDGDTWYQGSGVPYIWVKSRTYTNLAGTDTTGMVLFMTAAQTYYDWNDDSVQVNISLGKEKTWYEIDANADTSVTADSLYYMKPFMGKMFIAAAEAPPGIPPDAGTVYQGTNYEGVNVE